jgi:predicted small secreted protein
MGRIVSGALAIMLALALAACNTVGGPSGGSALRDSIGRRVYPAGTVAVDAAKLTPSNPNAFVMLEKPEQLQRFGYDHFCPTTETISCARLPYQRYVGLKGYFEPAEPVATNHAVQWDFFKVVLENGEWFYFTNSRKSGDLFRRGQPIMRLSQHEQGRAMVDKPFLPNGALTITQQKQSSGYFYYTLSNGSEFRDDQLASFQKLATHLPEADQGRAAEILSNFHIKHDDIADRFIVRPVGMDHGPLYGRLLIKGKPQFRLVLRYDGSDWLFVRNYIMAIGEERLEGASEFRRDHTGGKVWEWIDVAPTREQRTILSQLANAEKATVRFIGRDYYKDLTVTDKSRKEVGQLLELERMFSKL